MRRLLVVLAALALGAQAQAHESPLVTLFKNYERVEAARYARFIRIASSGRALAFGRLPMLLDLQQAPAVGGGASFPLSTSTTFTDVGAVATFYGGIGVHTDGGLPPWEEFSFYAPYLPGNIGQYNLVAGHLGFVGQAGGAMTTATGMAIYGDGAGAAIVEAHSGTLLGQGSYEAGNGAYTTSVGGSAMSKSVGTAVRNSAFGSGACNYVSGEHNTCIGSSAGGGVYIGGGTIKWSTMLGAWAGRGLTNTASNPVVNATSLGYRTNYGTAIPLSHVIALGGYAVNTKDNQFVVGAGTDSAHVSEIVEHGGASGQQRIRYTKTEVITVDTGDAVTNSVGDLILADSRVESVTCYVTTGVTTAVNVDVGTETTDTKYDTDNANVAITNSFVVGDDDTIEPANSTLVLTFNATPGAGVMRCTVHGVQMVAATS